MTNPYAVGAEANGARVRVIGDPWAPTVSFLQSNGQPLDLSTAQFVGADIYIEGIRGVAATIPASVPVPTNGIASYLVSANLTAQAVARDPDFSPIFPTRLVAFVVDAAGRRHTEVIVLYCPVSAAAIRSLPLQDDGVTVTVSETITLADVSIIATLFFAILQGVPKTKPDAAGVLWLNGGSLEVSQP